MTSIYVDRSAAGAPDAADHLRHLVDTGHQVFLLDGSQSTVATDLGAPIVPKLPADAPRGSWFVTADPATCGERQSGVRSLLVGPRPAPSPRPTPRCDAEARDLASAVLEILSRDVMP
jgi:hypothetical protein